MLSSIADPGSSSHWRMSALLWLVLLPFQSGPVATTFALFQIVVQPFFTLTQRYSSDDVTPRQKIRCGNRRTEFQIQMVQVATSKRFEIAEPKSQEFPSRCGMRFMDGHFALCFPKCIPHANTCRFTWLNFQTFLRVMSTCGIPR